MISLIYKVGTASVSTGSAIVSGTDTSWLLSRVNGGMFSAIGRSVPIASVESDTELTLAYPWAGPDYSGQYAIGMATAEASDNVFVHQTLVSIIKSGFLATIPIVGLGDLTERDAKDPVSPGDVWLYWETGNPLAYYIKTNSGWDGPFPIQGSDGSEGPAGVGDKYEIGVFIEGRPGPSERVIRHVFASEIDFIADLSPSQANAGTAATGATVFSIKKNGVGIGTLTFGISSDTGVFDVEDPHTFEPGDVLEVTAPASRDATLADVSITISGSR